MLQADQRERMNDLLWEIHDWIEADEVWGQTYLEYLDEFDFAFVAEPDPDGFLKQYRRLPEWIQAWHTGITVEAFLAEEWTEENPTDALLDEMDEWLSPEDIVYIRALQTSSMSVYVVEGGELGVSISLRDVVRGGDPVQVFDPRVSEEMLGWRYVAARVLPFGEGHILGGYTVPIPEDDAETFLEFLGETAKEARNDLPEGERETADVWPTVLHLVPPFVSYRFLDEAFAETARPEREVEFRYSLRLPADQLTAKIDRLKQEFLRDEEDPTVWNFHPGGKAKSEAQAWVFIEGEELCIQGDSVKRVKAAEAKLEKDLRLKLGKPRRTEREIEGEDIDVLLPDLQDRFINMAKEQLDEPLEEFEGRSLRQLAQIPSEQHHVRLWLSKLEESLAEALQGRRLDLSPLLTELGLP
ncbi:MAG: hypothetical protein ACO1SV_14950 [Fimbriimonas sp.]